MAVSFNSVLPFNPIASSHHVIKGNRGIRFAPLTVLRKNNSSVTGSSISSSPTKTTHFSLPLMLVNSKRTIKPTRKVSHVLASENDSLTSPDKPVSPSEASEGPTSSSESENKIPSSDEIKPPQKKAPLTARERLRAARVLSRDSESKPTKKVIGRSVLDALRESEKGKKGLPQAPTNMLDDQKRGMPKAGLTFDLPGGFDLFVIAFSFVFISTVMFATTYFVWKVGAIHFNEN